MKIALLVSRNYGYNWLIHRITGPSSHHEFAVFESAFLVKGKGTCWAAWHLLKKSCPSYLAVRAAESVAMWLAASPPLCWLAPGTRAFDLDWVCRSRGIQHYRTRNLCSDASIDRIRAYRPDLIVSLTAQRIRSSLLALPLRGTINVHMGVLPDYRGIAPYVWAMSHGGHRLGVSVHYIRSEGMDTGDLLCVRPVSVPIGASIAGAFLRCVSEAECVLAAVLDQMESGNSSATKQGTGSYFGWPRRSTMRALRKRKYRCIKASDLVGILRPRRRCHVESLGPHTAVLREEAC